jgi:hypothetical protein
MNDLINQLKQGHAQGARDSLLHTQKIQAYLAAWSIEEVQKYLGIASTERLRIPVPDYRYYHVDPGAGHVKLYINGENTQSDYIDIYFNFDSNSAEVYAPSVHMLIRPDRVLDFDMMVISPDKLTYNGGVGTTVNFTEALERVPTWNAMPVPSFKDMPNRRPRVIGSVTNG